MNHSDPRGMERWEGYSAEQRAFAEMHDQLANENAWLAAPALAPWLVVGAIELASIAVEGVATLGTRTFGQVTKRAEGVVYRRIDASAADGKPYIGRAKSQERFEARQSEHARVNPHADYKYIVLDRQKSGDNLRNAEQREIENHGGPTNRSNPDGGTENKRLEIERCIDRTRSC